jgi:hypothetical protein
MLSKDILNFRHPAWPFPAIKGEIHAEKNIKLLLTPSYVYLYL